MRRQLDVCGCFPTGRHYPGIAERIAQAIESVEGLWDGFERTADWRRLPLAVIDCETTGLDPALDRIIELGIVCFDRGELSARRSILVNPGIPIQEESRRVHQITDEELAKAPPFEQVAEEVAALLRDRLPVAYNAEFDRRFVQAEFGRLESVASWKEVPALDSEVRWVDPLTWARELDREAKSNKLVDVCERLGVTLDQAHRAASDAEAAGRVLLAFAPRMPSAYAELIRIQGSYSAAQDAELSIWRTRRSDSPS